MSLSRSTSLPPLAPRTPLFKYIIHDRFLTQPHTNDIDHQSLAHLDPSPLPSDSQAFLMDSDTQSGADNSASSPLKSIVQWGSTGCVRSHGDSNANPISVEDVRLWPTDFYVCDIAEFFRLASLPENNNRPAPLFTEFFGIPYASKTFKRTRRIWRYKENQRLHAQYIECGQSDQGMWSAFMKKASCPPGVRV